jgi:uncharacterized membrane protein YbhN (UPF0104 family)
LAADRSWIRRLVLSIAAGALVCWILLRGALPVVPDAEAFRELRPWAAPAYAATLLVVHFFRAFRWRHLLRPLGEVPLRAVLGASWLGFAAILWMPLRSGEAVRPVLLARQGRVRGWEAAGTVGAERVLDGVAMTAILLAALALSRPVEPLPDRVGDLDLPVAAVRGGAWMAMGVFAAALCAMLIFYWRREQASLLVERILGARVAGVLSRVANGLVFLPSRRLAPFAVETFVYWSANFAGLWLLGRGTGLDLSLAEAAVVMGVLGLGILTPSAPGYFGTFQLSMYLGLAMFVDAARVTGSGSAFVFVAYAAQSGMHALGALVGYALLRTPKADNLAEPSRAA